MAVMMEGPLSKWTNVVKGWQYRWFVLDDTAGLLSYFTVRFTLLSLRRKQIRITPLCYLDLFSMNMNVLTGSVGLIDHFIELIINGLNR